MTYNPNLGRWLQVDPIGFDGGDANLYRFVGNSPTNAVDPSGLELQRVGGKPVKLKDNKFKFGEGEATISVWTDATVLNPKNDKSLKDLIFIQFESSKDSAKDVHLMQFRYRYQFIDKDTEGHFIVNTAKPGGATVLSRERERTVDSLSRKSACSDENNPNGIRTDRLLGFFDRPGMYAEKGTVEDGFVADVFVIASGKVVYHISWQRIAQWDGTEWKIGYKATGEQANRLPKWAQDDELLWGYEKIVNEEKLELGGRITVKNPVSKGNR